MSFGSEKGRSELPFGDILPLEEGEGNNWNGDLEVKNGDLREVIFLVGLRAGFGVKSLIGEFSSMHMVDYIRRFNLISQFLTTFSIGVIVNTFIFQKRTF